MIKRIFRMSLALALMLFGIAGIFLPFIPGLLLIFLGWAVMIGKNPKALLKMLIIKAKTGYRKTAKGVS